MIISKIDKILSNGKNKKPTILCKKGDELTLEQDNGDILIVSIEGNKFSIRRDDTESPKKT